MKLASDTVKELQQSKATARYNNHFAAVHMVRRCAALTSSTYLVVQVHCNAFNIQYQEANLNSACFMLVETSEL